MNSLMSNRSKIEYGVPSDGIQNFKNRFSFVSNSLTTVSVLGFKVLRTGSKLGCSLKKKKKKVFTQNHFLHSEQTSAAD